LKQSFPHHEINGPDTVSLEEHCKYVADEIAIPVKAIGRSMAWSIKEHIACKNIKQLAAAR